MLSYCAGSMIVNGSNMGDCASHYIDTILPHPLTIVHHHGSLAHLEHAILNPTNARQVLLTLLQR